MATQSLELKGLALPAIRTAGGYFSVRDKYDVAWGDLLLAVLTPIGSRAMNRQFGSSLHLAVDDPNDPALAQMVDYAVRDAAAAWCPHIVVHDVQVAREEAGVTMSIAFGLTEDAQIVSRTFRVSASQFNITGG